MTERGLAYAFDAEDWEPEQPPSMELCAGGGARSCKFFTMTPNGIECQRFTTMHPMLVLQPMGSKFIPERADCQTERAELP